jgi:hypothetical protein
LHPIVYISGILGVVLSPAAALQQRKLTEVEALRETNQRMTENVQVLQHENNRLASQVETMQVSVSNLSNLEQTLEKLSSLQANTVDEIEHQVKESKDILAHMQRNYQAELLQSIISVLLAIDADQNMLLSDEEIDDLIQDMEGIHDVDINNDQLKNIIIHEQGRSVLGIMEIAKQALAGNSDDNKIFHFVQPKETKKQ